MSKVTIAKKRHVKSTLAQGKPTVCVGKNGASRDVLEEIEKQLKKQEMVKVRILKTALAHEEAKQIAIKIAEQTEASLVEVRGHTFMLYKSDARCMNTQQ
jgi:putative YhbY family RNA-binding protein